jgi:hypothetical protein
MNYRIRRLENLAAKQWGSDIISAFVRGLRGTETLEADKPHIQEFIMNLRQDHNLKQEEK